MNSSQTIFTVGHSTHTIETFKTMLTEHSVERVVDVRSVPFSRWHPQFNREAVERSLLDSGISYIFLGLELGARSNDATCYAQGKVQYSRIASTEMFNIGLESVIKQAQFGRTALMCAEKEPLECHRTFLVAKALEKKSFEISHILSDSRIESNFEAMTRLLKLLKLPEQSLFETRDELVEIACQRQEAVIAYRSPMEANIV